MSRDLSSCTPEFVKPICPNGIPTQTALERLERLEIGVKNGMVRLLDVSGSVSRGSAEAPSHDQVLTILQLSGLFHSNNPTVINYLLKEGAEVNRLLRDLPEIKGSFGVGYPYYAIEQNGKTHAVREIGQFMDLAKIRVMRDSAQYADWNCVPCSQTIELPDFKQYCKTCPHSSLKPRDVYKALPDLDIILICEEYDSNLEAEVERRLADRGYHSSDHNIAETIARSERAITSVLQGRESRDKIPIDVHIWSVEDFERCMGEVAGGAKDVTLHARSLHKVWEDNPIDFFFDFLFSQTPIEVSCQPLWRKIEDERRRFKETQYLVDPHGVINSLKVCSDRAVRLLSDPRVAQTFNDRMMSW